MFLRVTPEGPALPGKGCARGFSLVELLVVIAILAILASLLLPSLSQAKESARKIQCLNNVRQLSITWQLYATDHEDRLVPNGYAKGDQLDGKRLWVVGNTHLDPESFTNRQYLLDPKYAAFAEYLQTPQIYRCPSDKSTIEIEGREHPKTRSYGLNGYLGWQTPAAEGSIIAGSHQIFLKGSEFGSASPSEILAFVDTAPGNVCHSAFVIYAGGGLKDLYYHLPSAQHRLSGTMSYVDGHVDARKWRDDQTSRLARERWIPNHLQLQFPGNKDLKWLREHATVERPGAAGD